MSKTMKRENLLARLLRALSGQSQVQVARRIGRSPSQIDQWEQGDVVPGQDDLRLLAERCAGITLADAGELLRLYETQSKAFRRRSEGIGAILDGLAARLLRHCLEAVRRLLKLALPEHPPSAEDRREAEERFAELKPLSGRSRLAVVRLNPAFQTWALVERCCDESVRDASRNLRSAASWARLALAIARRVRGPEGWCRSVLAYAFAHWANILRVRGGLEAAEACLVGRARQLWSAGSDLTGLLDPGRLLDLEASLRRAQRRFDEALFLSDQARAVSRCPERVMIQKATIYDVMGEYEKAVTTLLEAGPGVESGGDARLLYLQRFNLAAAYTHLRMHAQAADLLQQVRSLATELGDDIFLIRATWLEGRILAGLGRREEALRLLAQARKRFAAENMFYDVALALLEECGLLLEEGRTGEVKALTLELAEVFQSKGVHREALAALRLFQDAVEREAATAELAHRILAYLFRARHDQGLRFESPAVPRPGSVGQPLPNVIR